MSGRDLHAAGVGTDQNNFLTGQPFSCRKTQSQEEGKGCHFSEMAGEGTVSVQG